MPVTALALTVMYSCERCVLSLQEQEPRSPADEWRSAAVLIATTEQKGGGRRRVGAEAGKKMA